MAQILLGTWWSNCLRRLGPLLLFPLGFTVVFLWLRLQAFALTASEMAMEVERLQRLNRELSQRASLNKVNVDCELQLRSSREDADRQLRSLSAMLDSCSETPSTQVVDATTSDECEAHTFYVSLRDDRDLEEMALVRDHLLGLGWKQLTHPEKAAFLLDNGDSFPAKRGCKLAVGLGQRLPGSFGVELSMCHKRSLPKIARGTPDSGALRRALPLTFQPSDPKLEHIVPCEGVNEQFLLKGDAHGGRAVWQPESYHELRKRLGLKRCAPGHAKEATTGDLQDCVVQEIVRTIRWEERNVLARIYFAVLRSGETSMCPSNGKWRLGSNVGYKLFVFDEPFFVLYQGVIQDRASEVTTSRRNASELDAFLAGRRDFGPRWVSSRFMPMVVNITIDAFMASEYFMGLGADSLNRYTLEPDGAYALFATEVLITDNAEVKLVEFTSSPQVTTIPHGASTEYIPKLLGKEFTELLLAASGQDADRFALRDMQHWRQLAWRDAFPHP